MHEEVPFRCDGLSSGQPTNPVSAYCISLLWASMCGWSHGFTPRRQCTSLLPKFLGHTCSPWWSLKSTEYRGHIKEQERDNWHFRRVYVLETARRFTYIFQINATKCNPSIRNLETETARVSDQYSYLLTEVPQVLQTQNVYPSLYRISSFLIPILVDVTNIQSDSRVRKFVIILHHFLPPKQVSS